MFAPIRLKTLRALSINVGFSSGNELLAGDLKTFAFVLPRTFASRLSQVMAALALLPACSCETVT